MTNSKRTKVLFLDIDGVCNCSTTKERHGVFIGIDPTKANMVKRIIKETACSVVLSSTWRLDEGSRQHVKENVCEFIDVTVNLANTNFRGFRGEEVNTWLKEHPEVTCHAILDDDGDFYDEQPLFQTTWATGLNDDIANKVIKHLNDAK